MFQMTWEEFQKTRVYVEKKALDLMSHEKKNDTLRLRVELRRFRLQGICRRQWALRGAQAVFGKQLRKRCDPYSTSTSSKEISSAVRQLKCDWIESHGIATLS